MQECLCLPKALSCTGIELVSYDGRTTSRPASFNTIEERNQP